MIEGVQLYNEKHITLPHGDIYHIIKSTDEGFCGFGEAYFSQIKKGAVKGWRRHNRMTLNIVVTTGKIKFVVYDDRKNSATKGQFEEIVLSMWENYKRLTIAPGLWMAFQGVAEGLSMLMDIIPEPHDADEADRKALNEINYNFSL